MKRLRRKDIVAIFIILILALLTILTVNSYVHDGFAKNLFDGNTQAVTDQILSYGHFSYIAFFILIVMECVFAPFPPLILYIAGGTVFGGFVAGVIALTANVLGAAIAFKLAHHYGKEKLMLKIPKKINKKFDVNSKKYGPLSIFILRFNPFTSSDLFSYLAGFTNMNFKKFLIATGAGLSVIVFVQTYLGEQIQSNNIIAKASIIIGILYFIAFFVGYFAIKKKLKKNKNK